MPPGKSPEKSLFSLEFIYLYKVMMNGAVHITLKILPKINKNPGKLEACDSNTQLDFSQSGPTTENTETVIQISKVEQVIKY